MLGRLKLVFKSFQDHDVRYVVIGGIAAVLHGVPRATFDLDILIEPSEENAARLLEALLNAGLGTAASITSQSLAANEITIFDDSIRIDVLTSAPGITFADAWSRRLSKLYEGQEFFIASREDLIASKRASARPVDLEDVRILESAE